MDSTKNKIILGVLAFIGLYIIVSIVSFLISSPFSESCRRATEDIYKSPNSKRSIFYRTRDCGKGRETEILMGQSDGTGPQLVVFKSSSANYKIDGTEYKYPPVGVSWLSNSEVRVKVGVGENLVRTDDEYNGVKIQLLAPKP